MAARKLNEGQITGKKGGVNSPRPTSERPTPPRLSRQLMLLLARLLAETLAATKVSRGRHDGFGDFVYLYPTCTTEKGTLLAGCTKGANAFR